MTIARLVLISAVCLPPAFGTYTYDYANLLNPYNSGQWSITGTISPSTNLVTSSNSNGGSMIFTNGLPAPSNSYEVRTTLQLNASGGNYITYLRASNGSLLATGNGGTFYAIEVANPVISGSSCTATLNIFKQTGAGTLINPYSSGITCHNGMVVRAVVITANAVAVYIDNRFYTSWGWGDGSPIVSGQPGVGVSGAPSSNGISAIDIGHMDTVAPNGFSAQQVGTGSYPTHVDFQFPGDVDDANGIGIAYYQFWRNGNWLSMTTEPQFTDTTVAAGTTYSYTLQAQDYHYNTASVTVTVTTPPAGSIDPRRVGVRPNGTYWGYGGEQIDMRSANLSYSIPLLRAMARGGWSVGFSLSYNSDNWRQDPGGTWQLGRDIGYGYGWKLLAGSVTPVYRDYWTIDHYLFIDSTSAEYRLDQNSGGVWSSKEAVYVYYDSNTGLLRFRDGSFWAMGALSAGTEQDAGTLYPTQMEDANGNQLNISYYSGTGVTWTNSSSRINTIADVRKGGLATYTFSYNADSIPHLTGITNSVGTSENYTFAYISNYSLTSPFAGGTGFGTYTMLQCANSATIPGSTTFAYDGAGVQSCANYSGGSGAGELTQMSTPAGGHIRWGFGSFTYLGTRTFREVNARFLSTTQGGTEAYYNTWFQGDANLPFHTYSGVDDPDGLSEKAWNFVTDSNQASYGLVSYFEHRPHHWPNIAGETAEAYGWTTNASGNPYISTVTHTDDNGNPTAVTKTTTQTLDQYGNLTQMLVYNYGGTLARTYTNTYLNTSNYTTRYIFNRLASSTVTDGTKTTTLVQNSYDQNPPADVPNITMHDSAYNNGFSYRGNVSSSVTPGGTKTAYYDIGGNTTSVTANGVTTSVSTTSSTNWAAPSQFTTSALSSSLNWDMALSLTSTTGPNGDTGSIVYGGGERPSSSTSPFGAITTYTYTDGVNPTKTATTNGHWVKTTMDGFGRPVKTESGNGTTTVSQVDVNYTSCGCTPIGKMNKTSAPHAPNGSVNWTTHYYDGLGRTTSVVAPDGSTTRYTYSGNTVTVYDPTGRWKTFTMDALGNLTQVSEPSAPGNSGVTVTADSATPSTGSGFSQTFSLQYSDTAGATSFNWVWVWFNSSVQLSNGANSCMIYYSRGTNGVYLLNDAGTSWSAPATPGSNVTLQNSQCSLSVAGASVSVNGNILTLNLPMTFTSAYSGLKYVYIYGGDNGGSNSGWQPRGTWTVGTGGGAGVAAPTFNPPPSIYTTGQTVTISSGTSGATIRYTTDGSLPTESVGMVYSGPVTVSASMTLNAIAYKAGMTDSFVTSGSYTIQSGWGGTPYVTTYTYDILSHLTGVSMTRGSATQTRTFTYASGSTVGALLLSATNPENGTVSYTYNTDMTLATKTDAKGQVFSYSYDGYKRLTQVSVGANVLRNYVYDTNPDDSSYSGPYTAGRLTEIKYPAILYSASAGGPQASTTFTDMFSYTQAGALAGKRLRVAKTNPYQQGGQWLSQPGQGDLNLAYTYNNEGKPTQIVYPYDAASGNSPTYNYTYDAMARLNGMTGTDSGTVSNVSYGPANELLSINYYGATETRTYNSLLQLTNISATVQGGTGINQTYNYTGAANNGKIASMTDALSGETVAYQYDSLNRLISAAGSGWTQTQSYDGFGNLTGRVGTGTAQSTTMSTPADAATNRLAGYSYDANGNLLSTGNVYDSENRLGFANIAGGMVEYFNDAQNKRIWQGTCTLGGNCQQGVVTTDTITLFGADGRQVATYQWSAPWNNTQTQVAISFQAQARRAYFGGKLVAQSQSGVMLSAVQDRLGSVGKYYPYGEERNSPPLASEVKFATYTRDSGTGLDYADQRYYASTFGRFMTPDPYKASGGVRDPKSWNRYAYVEGDPVNFNDPHGRIINPVPYTPEDWCWDDSYYCWWWPSPSSSGGDPPDPFNDNVPMSFLSSDQQKAQVRNWTIYLLAAEAVGHASRAGDAGAKPFPLYLKVTQDCYRINAGAGTRGTTWTREVDYELYGSDGRPLSDPTAIISEHLTPIQGTPGVVSNSNPGGQFEDTISVGNYADFTVLQQFTVTVASDFGIPGFTNVPVFVMTMTGTRYGSNVISANPSYVDINGDPNLGSNGSHPLCPTLQ